jgi:hypothetical protein
LQKSIIKLPTTHKYAAYAQNHSARQSAAFNDTAKGLQYTQQSISTLSGISIDSIIENVCDKADNFGVADRRQRKEILDVLFGLSSCAGLHADVLSIACIVLKLKEKRKERDFDCHPLLLTSCVG